MGNMSAALSGLKAAQAGLAITGHNVSNSSVRGYTRQQLIQQDSSYLNKGSSSVGCLKMQVGLGANTHSIRQIRNKFYDVTYREENSAAGFYARKYTAGSEINNIIGELQGEYKPQDAIEGIWNSVNELIKDPAAIETRASFIQSCVVFYDKMKDISKNLVDYQLNLNEQLTKEVKSINNIVGEVAKFNEKIQEIEASGTNANDLRDTRNNLLDELSGFVGIEFKEVAVENGSSTRIEILIDGKELLTGNVQQKLGLKYAEKDSPFYEVVFSESKKILPFDATERKLFDNLFSQNLTGVNSDRAKGSLKGLLIARGNCVGNFTTPDDKIGNSLIPNVQKKIDTLTHEIVTMLNSAVMDNGTVDLNGNAGIPIFIRKSGLDYNAFPENITPPIDYRTLYTIDNIEINPKILDQNGYNKLAFTPNGSGIGDTTILTQIAKDWKSDTANLENASIDEYYKKIITDFGVTIREDQKMLQSKIGTSEFADNRRLSISAVSLDEELSNMMIYQHAYNAAAKIINVLDGMMDKIINGTAV